MPPSGGGRKTGFEQLLDGHVGCREDVKSSWNTDPAESIQYRAKGTTKI
ncbi:MAG: hypothetical protein OEM39_04015 [Acidimicrobiia bacterium]|nr:hypothetical protein [Acidimicrobiia bacterium]MDH3462508.1 hypothetical protein [Acidimicrobiia bacterium]